MQAARAFAALIRPRDWVKNALVLAPLLFGARLFEPAAVGFAALAALAYCLAASAGYIWNDFADREADRLHPAKRRRPLASGAVGATQQALLRPPRSPRAPCCSLRRCPPVSSAVWRLRSR
jgi:4-hydroxybenzoate polyprenyltransferase